jgi:hypothetical protein
MSDKTPSLADEIRQARKPRLNVVLPPRGELPDEAIEQQARVIGEKWGSTTQLTSKEPERVVEVPATFVSNRFDFPDYLDEALAVTAATTKGPRGEKRVTKTYLVLKALKEAGYPVKDVDLVADRRLLPAPRPDRGRRR